MRRPVDSDGEGIIELCFGSVCYRPSQSLQRQLEVCVLESKVKAPCSVGSPWGLVLRIGHRSPSAGSKEVKSRQNGPSWEEAAYPQLLLLSEEVVALISLVQGDQDIFEPVTHAQRELGQLCIQARGDV